MIPAELVIRDFRPPDQDAARRLVLAGLAERFGWLDETLNPDLIDIHASYVRPGGRFLVGCRGAELVATAALAPEPDSPPGLPAGRLARVSVAREGRRQGIARRMVAELIASARTRGMTRLYVETNADWMDAIALYESFGFRESSRDRASVHFSLEL